MNDLDRRRAVAELHPGQLRRIVLSLAQRNSGPVDALIELEQGPPVPVHVPGQIEIPC